MTRTESDLRAALHDLEQQADRHGGPSAADILARATGDRIDATPGATRHARPGTVRHLPRWLPPVAAAAVAAAVAIGVIAFTGGSDRSPTRRDRPVAASRSTVRSSIAPKVTSPPKHIPTAASILADAAIRLDAAPAWTAPAPSAFYYVRTTDATTWTSVSGLRPGQGHNAAGVPVSIPGCVNGQIVATGESGSCTLNDVPHYRADAPTTPRAWDAYLERIAPGAKAAGAQGKIIVQVLHGDLVAPRAVAALLRYTASGCAGLHLVAVRPVAGRRLLGVTCTSMTNGSYGLAFDATTHAFVGYVPVGPGGTQASPAELVLRTGIVAAPGRTP